LILATDTRSHLEDLAAFRLRLSAGSFDPLKEVADQEQLLKIFFRAADIGHSAKCWDLHEVWSKRVVEEFHQQGDEEKRLGLKVSPLCEREGSSLAPGQMGFLSFICLPTWKELARFEDSLQTREPKESAENHRRRNSETSKTSVERRATFAGSTALGVLNQAVNRAASPIPTRFSVTQVVPMASCSNSPTPSSSNGILKRWLHDVCLLRCEKNYETWKCMAEGSPVESGADRGRSIGDDRSCSITTINVIDEEPEYAPKTASS